MDSLSSKQQAFIKLMKDGEDFERRGFELLLKRPDFDVFFEALENEGLFDPYAIRDRLPATSPAIIGFPIGRRLRISKLWASAPENARTQPWPTR